jgi:putative ABC transport system ATP-binding protein
MAIIELKDVSKLYGFGDATTVALDEVNLTFQKGEFVAIMGPSGSGKSTLMNIIGLLDRPTNGSYSLNGRSVARLKAGRQAKIRRDKIGFVFQYYNLLPRLTALENVALPLAYRGVSLTKRLKQASAMLEQVGLQEKEYFMPGQLSGGQVQRVAIARALLTNPDIIIADEPTGNLDSAASLLVMELLSEIHRNGRTVLMVTHNPELTRYANRVVYMQDGVIVHDEPSEVGRVPIRARRLIYSLPKTTEDDDIAGVSALMSALPGRQPKKSARAKSPRRRSRSKKTTKRKVVKS